MRIILLVDFDYYYAQLEEIENPEYKGKPLVICVYSGRSEDSGAVATCNYEARNLGIRSGMPISFAKKRANKDTTFLPTRRDYYKKISDEIMEVMRSFADSFEQVSIDEAYLDISSKGSYQEAAKTCREIKDKIKKHFNLTCSIGVGPNKLVAKMSAGLNKPDGLTITKKENFAEIFHKLKVKKLHGIGPKIEKLLEENKVKTIGDLANFDLNKLKKIIGENKGLLLHNRANGVDDDPVDEREKKQISRLTTLKEDSRDFEVIRQKIHELAKDVKKTLDKAGIKFKTVSIITINPEIQTRTRSRTLDGLENSMETIQSVAEELLHEYLEEVDDDVRRIGVGVSNFDQKETKPKKSKNQSLSKFFS